MNRLTEFFFAIEPYVFQAALGAIALFGLVKDWRDYKEASGKFSRPVLVLMVLATLGVVSLSFVETHHSRKESSQKENEAKIDKSLSDKRIELLTEQVKSEQEDNKHNSDGFRQSFDKLYQKYSELAVKTKNAELLREIAETRKDLKETRDKLTQPKAKLTATFWHPKIRRDEVIHEVTKERNSDGSVSLDVMALNQTDTTALNGNIILRICVVCKYAKEPDGFVRLPGSEDQDRVFSFPHFLPNSADQKRTIDVVPPPAPGNRFQVDLILTCDNCITNKESLLVTVQ